PDAQNAIDRSLADANRIRAEYAFRLDLWTALAALLALDDDGLAARDDVAGDGLAAPEHNRARDTGLTRLLSDIADRWTLDRLRVDDGSSNGAELPAPLLAMVTADPVANEGSCYCLVGSCH